MIAWKFKLWRAAGAAAVLSMAAACGGEGGESGHDEGGEAGESGGAVVADGGGEAGEAAIGESGGESGEAGAASAYAGLSGDQLIALRIQHLKGFVMAAQQHIEQGEPAEAAVLVQQGLLEVHDTTPEQFGALNVDIIRAAADANVATRAEEVTRLRAAAAELQRASGALHADDAITAARMTDIATGIYQGVVQADFVDPIEYQHSLGAALAARDALDHGRAAMQRANGRAYTDARTEMDRFVALWPQATAPETPNSYREVLAQSSRVRLALSPFL